MIPGVLTKPGIYPGMSAETYFADPCPVPSLTQSIAKVLLEQSAAHARQEHPRLVDVDVDDADDDAEKYEKAKAIGNAAHAILIGRGKTIAIGEFDNWMKKEAKEFKSDAILHAKEPVLRKHYDSAAEMAKAARSQLEAADWKDAFTSGAGEVVLAWKEGEGADAIWLRTMIDWLTPDQRVIYDLKTSATFSPHGVGFKLDDDGWDVQAAMQERGLAVLDPDGRGRLRHRFVALESGKPYAMLPVELGEHHLSLGRRKLAVAINLWRASMKSGEWPGYPSKAITPAIPAPRENRWIEREMAMVDKGLWSIDDPLILGAPMPSRSKKATEPV